MTTKQQLLKEQRENNDEGYFNYCEICKKNKNSVLRLDEHHIVYKSEKPKHHEMENKRNKLILCDKCHTNLHDCPKYYRNVWIVERNLTELFGNDIIR